MVKNLIIAKWVLTRISKRSPTRGSLTSNLAGPIRFLYQLNVYDMVHIKYT